MKWITREKARVDRIACPWLISRFVDREPTFLFVPADQVMRSAKEAAMLEHIGDVDLPPHTGTGGFDHAAVHARTGRVYVAHTANDAVDVIDGATGRFVDSIGGLAAVAGALVSDEHDLVFTSNRGEHTVGLFEVAAPAKVAKVGVGVKPNGLAYDP